MVASPSPLPVEAAVAVLFSPGAVPIVDIFRALGDFEDHYDVGALDQLEDYLARSMARDSAKGIVSGGAVDEASGPDGTRVAVLTDGTPRPTLYGRQGDVIEGRYRLLRVENDSIEIAYLDGTGRRRIPKTGQ